MTPSRTRRIVPHLALATLLAAGAITTGAAQTATAAGETVAVTMTTADLSQKLSPQANVAFSAGAGTTAIPITINEGRRYQTMVGFGATFTDSSAWLLDAKVSPANRAPIMQNLFTRNGASGIGLEYLRQPASSTDYIKDPFGYYTYDDLPAGQTDPTLSQFSIAHDQAYLIPILKEALVANPGIKVQLNSWTAPAWMKTNHSLRNGGTVLPQYRGVYAEMIIKSIQAYEAAGVPIWATSVANEPTLATAYPSMVVSASDSAAIIRDHLSPGLAAAGLSTRILGGDDVQFDTFYPSSVIDADARVSSEVPATSSHGYWGDFHSLSTLHDFYPNKDVYQTELASGCAYSPIDLTMRTVRNWAATTVTWNVALDENLGPFHDPAAPHNCTPLVQVNQGTGATTYTSEFYQQGQVSKFVLPGAVRIDTNDTADVPNLAFRNPDGSKALVAWNKAASARTFSVNWGNQHFDYTLPGGAIATFRWSGTAVGDAAGWGDSTFGTGAQPYGGGLRRGSWTITDAATVSQTALGGGEWASLFYGYADHADLTASADVRAVARGTSAAFPKYGIYACYRDIGNYVQAFLDPASGVYVAHLVAKGTDLGYFNTPLPSGFNAGVNHRISVQRSGDVFRFSLDGTLMDTRTAAVGSTCQLGTVTEDYRADFSNLSLVDPLRWSSSQLGTSSSNIYEGGVRRGDWAVSGADSVSITSAQAGWSSIFRGYLTGNQTVSVTASAVSAGTTSTFPKYGVYAAYRDPANYMQGWIDPTSGNFATHGRVGGTEVAWNNTPLPAGFDAKQPHVISVTRTGDSFAFRLDGVLKDTRTAAVGQGQFGLVSEAYKARFRNITISSDAPAAGVQNGVTYRLYNRKGLRQLSVLGGGTANSTQVDVYDPVAGQPDQLWTLQLVSGSSYRVVNQKSGALLSTSTGGTANNTNAIIYSNVGAADQTWTITPSPNAGYFRLSNDKSGRLLSVFQAGTENENRAIIYDNVGAVDQDWVLAPVH